MRSINRDIMARFEAYKESLKVDTSIAIQTANHCARIVKKGINCAVIIGSSNDLDHVTNLVVGALADAEIKVVSSGRGGILTKDGVQIRILTQNTEMHAHILLGNDCEIISVKDGDPRFKKVSDVFDL